MTTTEGCFCDNQRCPLSAHQVAAHVTNLPVFSAELKPRVPRKAPIKPEAVESIHRYSAWIGGRCYNLCERCYGVYEMACPPERR